MTNPHSTWQMILSLYNIPSWLWHLKQAVIDIDVFLEPLMEDMRKLWEEGVCV
jgi:hypothetical protein